MAWRVFCILLCVAQIYTTVVRLEDFAVFLSAQGAMPLATLREQFSLTSVLSIFSWVQSDYIAIALMVISILMNILAAVGRAPLISWPLSWYFCWAIQSRNEMIVNGADHYLRILFFWAAIYEITKWYKNKNNETATQPNSAYLLFTAQIMAIYFFSGAHKLFFETWRDGSAFSDILGYSILVSTWAAQLKAYPQFCQFINYATIGFELGFPLIFLISTNSRIRWAAWSAAIVFHLLILFSMNLYLIPVMSIISLVGIIPFIQRNDCLEFLNAPTLAKVGLAYLLLLNISSLPLFSPSVRLKVSQLFEPVRLDQSWNFFAPPPSHAYEFWWEVESTDRESRNQSFVLSSALNTDRRTRPTFLSTLFKNQNWTAYAINMASVKSPQLSKDFLNYLCRALNHRATNAQHLVDLDLVLKHQQKDGANLAEWQDQLAAVTCAD